MGYRFFLYIIYIIKTIHHYNYEQVSVSAQKKESGELSIPRGAANVQELLLRISAFANKPLVPGKTLIFFDEIQDYPDIPLHCRITALLDRPYGLLIKNRSSERFFV